MIRTNFLIHDKSYQYKNFIRFIMLFILIVFLFFCLSSEASAEITNKNLLDDILTEYKTAAISWKTVLEEKAKWLFWTLALISLVWTASMMLLQRAEIGDFFLELIRFIIFLGFFWWLLLNGTSIAQGLISSMKMLSNEASQSASDDKLLTPSAIIDLGFIIFKKSTSGFTLLDVAESILAGLIGLVCLVILAICALNQFILLIMSWFLAYAGIIFLGFGGSRWTSEVALNYYRQVIANAIQLFTIGLIIGLAENFIKNLVNKLAENPEFDDLAVLLITSITTLFLVDKLPPMMSQIAFTGFSGQAGANFGAKSIPNGINNSVQTVESLKTIAKGINGLVEKIKGADKQPEKPSNPTSTQPPTSTPTNLPQSKDKNLSSEDIKNQWEKQKNSSSKEPLALPNPESNTTKANVNRQNPIDGKLKNIQAENKTLESKNTGKKTSMKTTQTNHRLSQIKPNH
jgi:type IV secretion system protein TrbL